MAASEGPEHRNGASRHFGVTLSPPRCPAEAMDKEKKAEEEYQRKRKALEEMDKERLERNRAKVRAPTRFSKPPLRRAAGANAARPFRGY